MEQGFNAADLAIFYLEQFCQLPGPVYEIMIKECKGKDYTLFSVHCHKSTVTNPGNNPSDPFFELFFTGSAGLFTSLLIGI